ncbi:MAG TPA: hypothetical protein VIH01_00945 [Blastococcus sp.]
MDDHGAGAGNAPSDPGAGHVHIHIHTHDEALADLYEEWLAPATEPDDSGGG